MGALMKTTIEINDELLRRAKRAMQARGTTLKALVEQGLRQILDQPESVRRKPIVLKVHQGEMGFAAGFANADWSRIKEAARRR